MIEAFLKGPLYWRLRACRSVESHPTAEIIPAVEAMFAAQTRLLRLQRDAIPNTDVCYLGTNGYHLPCSLVSQNKRLRDFVNTVSPILIVVLICSADSCRSRCDLDLVRPWGRRFDTLDDQLLSAV
jgi:hypothetical protein